ncbi:MULTISPECIES: hypothetical protein [Agrobacterium]|uniref:hypothetical protein n=1 Tax=Agrobacterium TaxID=357 RepID=UPI0009BC0967|nr:MULTISPECIES: hypothetical protein [Agrobacterium]QCL72137.1 hypothetical protein CFBP5499_00905 [Agrobacterium tumefaciens]CUX23768.1 hypothetical protein AGR6A_Cc150149 [Agrobacterium sp. NCPPB 925]
MTVITFTPRRTYLDECRARGVRQEAAERSSELDRLLAVLSDQRRDRSACVVDLAARHPGAAELSSAVDVALERFRFRCEGILKAFEAASLGAESVPFLRHILFQTTLGPEASRSLFSKMGANTKDQQDA